MGDCAMMWVTSDVSRCTDTLCPRPGACSDPPRLGMLRHTYSATPSAASTSTPIANTHNFLNHFTVYLLF